MYKLRHTQFSRYIIERAIIVSRSKWNTGHEFVTSSCICCTYTYIRVPISTPISVTRRERMIRARVRGFVSNLGVSRLWDVYDIGIGTTHDGITRPNRAAATPVDAAQFWACHKFRSPILSEMSDAARPTTLRFGPGMPGPPCAKFRRSFRRKSDERREIFGEA